MNIKGQYHTPRERKIMNRIVIGTVLIGLLSACASTPSPQTTSSTQAISNQSANSGAVASNATQKNNLPPYKDPSNVLSQKRNVFFDFDQTLIKDEYKSVIEAHAKYLAVNRNEKIRIEGNTDEQGSSEYNLALGQKRAQAVVKALTVLGIKEDQMEAVSWGKERPKASGHDETAWAQNRRADIKYHDE
jgi:peptidoglycan-associated lipoprotein